VISAVDELGNGGTCRSGASGCVLVAPQEVMTPRLLAEPPFGS
jgi:hypothetical protein